MIDCWHGGWALFNFFNYDAIGSGENDSLGYGFYFSEHRKGGEYYAEYMNFRHSSGFLYQVQLQIDDSKLLYLDNVLGQHPQSVIEKVRMLFHPDEVLHAQYSRLRLKLGDKQTAHALIEAGIKALHSKDGHKPGHGCTYLVLDNSVIKILSTFKFEQKPYSWAKIESTTQEQSKYSFTRDPVRDSEVER